MKANDIQKLKFKQIPKTNKIIYHNAESFVRDYWVV